MSKKSITTVTLCVAETGGKKGKAPSLELKYTTGDGRIRRTSMAYLMMLVRDFDKITREGGKEVWEEMAEKKTLEK